MTLPTGSNDFPQGLGTVNIEGKLYTPVSVDIPTEAVRIIERTDEVGNPSDYHIRLASEKITGTIIVNQDPPFAFQLGMTTEQTFDRHSKRLPKSGQKLFYDGNLTNNEGTLFCTITDVKVVRGKDTADQIELGVLLEYFSVSHLTLNVKTDNPTQARGIALQPTSIYNGSDYYRGDFVDCGNWWINSNNMSVYNFGVGLEYLWRIPLNNTATFKEIGVVPSDVGEINLQIAMFFGNFHTCDIDYTNSSSHIISDTKTFNFIDSGNNVTEIQAFDIVVDTDEANDIDLAFTVPYSP